VLSKKADFHALVWYLRLATPN